MTVFEDRSFSFILKTPPASNLIMKAIGLAKGSANPLTTKVGAVEMHHGVWATHGHLYTPEAYAAHKDVHAKASEHAKAADADKAKAHDVARAYVSGDAMAITSNDVGSVDQVLAEDVKRG
jgi:hypothetical protein